MTKYKLDNLNLDKGIFEAKEQPYMENMPLVGFSSELQEIDKNYSWNFITWAVMTIAVITVIVLTVYFHLRIM